MRPFISKYEMDLLNELSTVDPDYTFSYNTFEILYNHLRERFTKRNLNRLILFLGDVISYVISKPYLHDFFSPMRNIIQRFKYYLLCLNTENG